MQAIDQNYAASTFSVEQTFAGFNFTEVPLLLPGLTGGDIEWGDYDSDGDLDFIVMGEDDLETPHTFLYRNDNGSFTDANAVLPSLHEGALAWSDFDGDSDIDLAMTGRGPHTALFRNHGGGFVPQNFTFENSDTDVAFGDMDQDGDLDLVFARRTIYRNATFARYFRLTAQRHDDAANFGFTVLSGAVALEDYDKDGRLDMLD